MDVTNTGLSLLSWFGLIAAALMLITYAFEHISHWFVLLFALSCILGALYGFLQGAWPFGVLLLWAAVAYWRWHRRRHREAQASNVPQ